MVTTALGLFLLGLYFVGISTSYTTTLTVDRFKMAFGVVLVILALVNGVSI